MRGRSRTSSPAGTKEISHSLVRPERFTPFAEEKPFTYTKVTPTTATVIATTNGSDALVTSNKVGTGEVILSTPAYLQTAARDALLNVGVKLFDTLDARYAIVKVIGAPVEYIVNRGNGKTIVSGSCDFTVR